VGDVQHVLELLGVTLSEDVLPHLITDRQRIRWRATSTTLTSNVTEHEQHGLAT